MAKQNRGLQQPTNLKPLDSETGLYQVIIETPKGSRNKFAYDTEQRIFSLKKVLPAGMDFPYDFGFLPRTLADDGEQIDGKKRVRNDRIVAVAAANHRYADIKKLEDLPSRFVNELEKFFVNYHNLEGKKYKLLGCHSARTAQRLIEKASK